MAKEPKAANTSAATTHTQPVVAVAENPADKPRAHLVAAAYMLQCGALRLTSGPRRGRVYDKAGKALRWSRAALLQPALAARFDGLGAGEEETVTDSMFGVEGSSPTQQWVEDAKLAASGLIRLPSADGKLVEEKMTAKERSLCAALLTLNVNPNDE